jgi:hypothetical protein
MQSSARGADAESIWHKEDMLLSNTAVRKRGQSSMRTRMSTVLSTAEVTRVDPTGIPETDVYA